MRLIDADEIKKKKVYVVERHEKVVPVAEIDWADSIDIVRCKDCKHFEPEREGYCPYNHLFTVPEWFCADGERR